MTNLSYSKEYIADGYVSPALALLDFVNEGILCGSLDGIFDEQTDATIADMPEVDFPWNS